MKKLVFSILFLVVLLLPFSSSSEEVTLRDKLLKIDYFVRLSPIGMPINEEINRGELKQVKLYLFENTTLHNNFLWTWKKHILYYLYHKEERNSVSKYIVMYYNKNIDGDTISKTEWSIRNAGEYIYDGFRNFEIVLKDGNKLSVPMYPPNFRNMEWYTPNKEEVKKEFEKEVDFWYNWLEKHFEKD